MNTTSKDIKIAVLGGGFSDERDVSLRSATESQKALLAAGYVTVDLLDPSDPDFIVQITSGRYDLAFPVLHGVYGEDGCVQGLLEILHIPYAFSDVTASAVAFNKKLAKDIYVAAGLPTPQSICVEPYTVLTPKEAEAVTKKLGLPLFVKPVGNGSSYGISCVKTPADINAAIKKASRANCRILLEEKIEGTEITIPVLGNNSDARALPVIEIVFEAEFYDDVVKYEPSELHHIIPARLDPDLYALAQQRALLAHRALGCSGASRSDFIITAGGEPMILETNTIPGMTETSLFPDSARHAGIDFPKLCSTLVELAFKCARH